MTIYRLLGIALHSRVDCRVNPQAIGIDIIERAIFLGIFLTPSTQRVGSERDGVDDKLPLVPCRVVVPARPVHHHILSQELTKIYRHAILMVRPVELQLYRLIGICRELRRREESRLPHLGQHHIASFLRTFGIPHGVEERRVLA